MKGLEGPWVEEEALDYFGASINFVCFEEVQWYPDVTKTEVEASFVKMGNVGNR